MSNKLTDNTRLDNVGDNVSTPTLVSSAVTGKPIIAAGATGPRIYFCAGTPLNVIVAPIGSIALRSDGGALTSFYVKESGAGASTGWVAK